MLTIETTGRSSNSRLFGALFRLALGLCVLPLGCIRSACHAAEPAALPPAADVANANVAALLSTARTALDKLDHPDGDDNASEAKIRFDTAVESLTALSQLHGCQWARPALRRLYARPDAPSLRLGYSADGRIQLRVEPLELQNPAFKGYTVLLCTFTSETARDVRDAGTGALLLTPPSGRQLAAQAVTAQHPLWPQLKTQAGSFRPLTALPSGAGSAFKQLYAIPAGSLRLNACAVSLDWGGYHFALPRWTGAD